MPKQESIAKKETRKILCDFETQKDRPIPAGRPDLVIVSKKMRTSCIVDFAVHSEHGVKES